MPLVAQVASEHASATAEATTAAPFLLRRGDREPSLTYTFPAGIDLDGAVVRFLVAEQSRTPIVDDTAAVTSIAARTVRYDWSEGDTDEPGRYLAEFEVTFTNGHVRTFPAGEYLQVHIKEDLD